MFITITCHVRHWHDVDGEIWNFQNAHQRLIHSELCSKNMRCDVDRFSVDIDAGVYQLDRGTERENPNIKQSLVASYNTVLAPMVKAACMDISPVQAKENVANGGHFPQRYRAGSSFSTGICNWFNQFSILLQRGLKERKHEAFNRLRVFQVVAAALLAGVMWWHSDSENIQDRLGLLFFISIFWGVFPSFNSVFAFPQERAIFIKERSSGMYSLSSYFMARIIGDMPMELILPTIFLSLTYWMSGLKPEFGAFVLTLLVVLGYVLASQGLGLMLGAVLMDAKQASTIVTVTMLAFVLTGGFYVHKVPSCLVWIKYVSTTFYSYRLLIDIQYGDGRGISLMLGCDRDGNSYNANCKFVEEDVVGQIRPGVCVGILLLMFFGFRLLAYLALRRIKA